MSIEIVNHKLLDGYLEQIYYSGSGLGKGGGSGSVTGVSGTSTDYANVMMALSEGQIEGIIGGPKGFFLDNTPLLNADGTQNFRDMGYYFSPGTLFQPGVPSAANEINAETSVGVEIKHEIPVTRTFTNPETNAIRVRLGVQLQRQTTQGDTNGEKVQFSVEIKEGADGAFVERLNTTISGRYADITAFQYIFNVNNVGGTVANYSIRITKISQDGTITITDSNGQTHIQNYDGSKDQIERVIQFLSFQQVIFSTLQYPNTAIVWIQFPSKLFTSQPKVSMDLGGVLFPIPTNATVDPVDGGLIYTGGWNGTFYTPAIAPADPAWILYGILTNKRYGLGRDITPDDINKFTFYSASQYNNQFVPDGFGRAERRFLFNGIIQGDQDAWEVITSICSNFAAKPFWDGSQISIWQDRPTDAIPKIITNADVEEGRFVYTSHEYKSIATVAKVTWNDPDQLYEQSVEVVEDPIGMNQYGVHVIEFTAFGETRRGGAVRAGRRVLFSSRLDNEQISFKCRPIASFFKPGEVIQVADSRRPQPLNPYDYTDWQARRKGGLVTSATTTAITLDTPVALLGAGGFKLWCTLPDLSVEMRDLAVPSGIYPVLNPTVPFSQAPLPHSSWNVQDGVAVPRLFRILSITPDRSNSNLFEVVGLKYSG